MRPPVSNESRVYLGIAAACAVLLAFGIWIQLSAEDADLSGEEAASERSGPDPPRVAVEPQTDPAARTAADDRTAREAPTTEAPRRSGTERTARTEARPGQATGPLGAQTSDAEPGRAATDPLGALRISGRVMDDRGSPVAAARVFAERVSTGVREAGAPARDDRPQAFTDATGRYELVGLHPGDYLIKVAPGRSHGDARTNATAGRQDVDLTVPRTHDAHVAGTVFSSDGAPLAGVRVTPNSQSGEETTTDSKGRYLVTMRTPSGANPPQISFRLDGYYKSTLRPGSGKRTGANEYLLDATLKRRPEGIPVTGEVLTSRGAPVAGERVILTPAPGGEALNARTDRNGRFSFASVPRDTVYALRVQPTGPYRDHSERLELARTDPQLRIVIEPLDSGRLRGRMVDAEGRGIANHRGTIYSPSAGSHKLAVSSDPQGRFEIEGVPTGALIFRSSAVPSLQVSGFRIDERNAAEVQLVLDIGDRSIEGLVVDERGQAVSGARVMLSWSHDDGSRQSRSRRTATSDTEGAFRFSGLGPGRYRMESQKPGFTTVNEEHESSRSPRRVELRMRRGP
jgi:protocatechuate 3,4-dioxygenase beta subunit